MEARQAEQGGADDENVIDTVANELIVKYHLDTQMEHAA